MKIKIIKTYNPKFVEGMTCVVRPHVGLLLVEQGYAELIDACGPVPDKITK
ncbi:hypothetical protein [Gluconobacter kondonii]|uniref:hypothetical protein n=1 Tax=Gluconobacter kondonii TaxID=941463 RepID=UPI00142E7F16|nr:hypothetical protein [Gluconobacter kondonii]